MSNYRTPPPVSYRGKGRNKGRHSRFWRVLFLCLALAAAILFGIARHLQRYMVYTREGAYLSFTGAVTAQPIPEVTEPLSELNVVEETAIPTVSRSDPSRLRAVEISVSQLLSGDAATLLAERRGNALVIEMKGADGVLCWPSQCTSLTLPQEDAEPAPGEEADGPDGAVPETISIPVSGQASEIADAVRECKADGVYLIAQLSLFRDDNLSASPAFGLSVPGWLNPSSAVLQDFYSNLAPELYTLGFDELLLTDAGYPADAGEDPAFRSVALSQFWAGFCQGLEASGASGLRVGVETDSTVLQSGENAATGQVLSDLISQTDRLWCSLPEVSPNQLSLDPAFLESGGLVLVGTQFQEGAFSPAQAVMDN